MHSLTLATALLAASCIAQPMEKRDIVVVTNYEVTYETVWVNPGENRPAPTPTPAAAPPPPAASLPAVEQPEPSPDKQADHVAPAQALEQAAAPAPSTTVEPIQAVSPQPAAAAVEAPAPKVQAAGIASSARTGNSFQAAAVNGHNALRAKHNAPPLSWDNNLAASAQALAATCDFHHDT